MSDPGWNVPRSLREAEEQRIADLKHLRRQHRIPLGWKVCAWLLLCMGVVGRIDMKVEEAAAQERTEKPYREPLALSHPLNCAGTWHQSCADFEPCKSVCIREQE